jgi:assimilatory nitrate reductase catalytic subunit
MKELSKLPGNYGQQRNLDISGMSYDKIEAARGIQWPYREVDDEGNSTNGSKLKGQHGLKGDPRLYSDGIFPTPNGKANLILVDFVNNNEQPCDEYPFWLNSGRVVEHFHTRTRTGKIGNCNKFSPTPYMEMNPDAAEELGIKHQEYVRLTSRRGDAVVMVQLTQRVARNAVFIPFHFHDCVNRLTLGLLDPYSRQPAFKQCSARIEKIDQAEAARINAERRTF